MTDHGCNTGTILRTRGIGVTTRRLDKGYPGDRDNREEKPEEEGVSEEVWAGKEAGCEEVGRVWRAHGRYDQEDWRFISNTISLCQVPARAYQYKETSKKGSDKEGTNKE